MSDKGAVGNGYNPLNWLCDRDGCFNLLRRPKIEEFAVCFPGRINFGDVDGIVEINGYFCMLEWKGSGGSMKIGQIITAKRFTKHRGNLVLVVDGDASSMQVHRYRMYWSGIEKPWKLATLRDVKVLLYHWARWAKRQPRRIA